jgi:hypothetical protein
MNRKITIIGVALSAVLAVGACAGGDDTAGDTGVAGGATGATGAAVTPTPTDTGLGATGVGATAGFTGAQADSIRRGTKKVP